MALAAVRKQGRVERFTVARPRLHDLRFSLTYRAGQSGQYSRLPRDWQV